MTTFRLQTPDLLHALKTKPIMMNITDGLPEEVKPTDKTRMGLVGKLAPMIHKAQKFIFDSGSDQDKRTVDAVRQTAVNMLEARLFHLPFPLILIEDPYVLENGQEDGSHRNFYLVEETETKITMWFFQRSDLARVSELTGIEAARLRMPEFVLHVDPLVIRKDEPSDDFYVDGPSRAFPHNRLNYGEAMYSLKKFIVALNTEQIEVERVEPARVKTSMDARSRTYPHTVVRVPLERTEKGDIIREAGTGAPRRRHLVQGFVWGKNVRPVEEQRWVRPHWRGDSSRGTVERTHYQVG